MSSPTRRRVTSLADLTPDPRNARTHTPRNVGMIVDALHEVGAARSIVIDEDGVILAGNATAEAAAEAGMYRGQPCDRSRENAATPPSVEGGVSPTRSLHHAEA